MLADVVKYGRWLWDAVLLPYVITSMSSLASDGWEAVTHLKESFVVLFHFLCGCSHRTFPLSRSAMEARRSAAGANGAASAESALASGRMRQRCYGSVSEGEGNDADNEADVKRGRHANFSVVAVAATKDVASSGQCVDEDAVTRDGVDGGSPLIQRRLLLGKKGEVEEWMSAVRSRLLVPPHHPLCTSRSLHQLVSIVVGPIQQPTVSTMPTRHPEPQWPPHFLRTNSSGGGGISGATSLVDASTDDNSSSNSSAAPHTLRNRTNTPATAAARYRQASSVVYKRVSSRNLDFSSSRVSPHLIASITAHHVLSYPATRQKVLVMDLDETLCHVSTTTANMAGPPTFSEVIPTASGAELFHVWERPYARLFLSTAAKLFNLVLFTSASKPYADTILQRIDPDHLLKYRYYRQDCRLVPRGLLRKMCEAASMRGLPLVSSGGVGRSSVGRGSSDRDRGDGSGTGDGSVTGGGVYGVSGSNHGPLGGLSSAAGVAGRTSGSATNSDDNGDRSSGGVGGSARCWGDALSPETRESPRGGDGAAANDDVSMASASVEVAALGGHNTGLPPIEKTVMNEHAKVLVKDLRLLKVPPELLVMIDNSEECTLVNPENALVIPPYIPSLSRITLPARETTRRRGSRGRDERVSVGGAAAAPTRRSKSGDEAAGDASEGRAASDAPAKDDDGAARVRPAEVDDIACGTPDDSVMGDDIAANDAPEDDEDEVLLALLPLLECLLVVPDVRSILRHGRLY
ncbi:hypothetical protein LSCM1_08127 [Leishmania martiniquensis]|uniref:FCP1 homology domain-containing protein n=1 Tax=Leishmania martiniquensis TaxID=1580590 RepID=A0A836KUR3_9TRYP|nr:hypothetical protein LSCM1_08127 [Leishmania martiniquensis]